MLKDVEAERVGEVVRGTCQTKAVGDSAAPPLQAPTQQEGWQCPLPRCVRVSLASTPLRLFTYQFPDQTGEVRDGGERGEGRGVEVMPLYNDAGAVWRRV